MFSWRDGGKERGGGGGERRWERQTDGYMDRIGRKRPRVATEARVTIHSEEVRLESGLEEIRDYIL